MCENGNRNTEKKPSLSAVPETELLDTSASKEKAHLVASGPMASRRLPTRRGSGVSQASWCLSFCHSIEQCQNVTLLVAPFIGKLLNICDYFVTVKE